MSPTLTLPIKTVSEMISVSCTWRGAAMLNVGRRKHRSCRPLEAAQGCTRKSQAKCERPSFPRGHLNRNDRSQAAELIKGSAWLIPLTFQILNDYFYDNPVEIQTFTDTDILLFSDNDFISFLRLSRLLLPGT